MNLLERATRLQSVLARAEFRWSAVDMFKSTGDVLTFGGPFVMAVAEWSPVSALPHAGTVFVAGLVFGVGGFALSRGAGWVEGRGREMLDAQQAADLSASLRALRDVIEGRESSERYTEQLLRCISDLILRVSPHKSAKVHCGLLRLTEGGLELVAFDRFRGNKVPGAVIPLSTEVGAGDAARNRCVAYVPDVTAESVPEDYSAKSYRCIISFPMEIDDVCVGVVSIDSTIAHHFDGKIGEIDQVVRPFVEVLTTFEMLRRHSLDGAAEVAR